MGGADQGRRRGREDREEIMRKEKETDNHLMDFLMAK